LKELRKIQDNKYVIYESCVLEYFQGDLEELKKEIHRVSGGDEYFVRINPSIFTDHLYIPLVEHGTFSKIYD
jgi:hypothetical protein